MERLNEFLSLGLRAFVDAIPAAIFVKDTESRLVLMNSTCVKVWGVSLETLYGTTGSTVFTPEQVQSFIAEDQRVFSSGQTLDRIESFWNAELQQDRIGHTFKRALLSPDGEPRYVVAVTIDITDQKHAESSAKALDEKLRGLFDTAPMGIALNDMEGRFVEFNQAFERLTGYTKEELRELDYRKLTPPEYAEQEARQLEALQTGGVYGPYEKEYLRKDGRRVPLQLNGTLIHDHAGQRFIWSIVQDISERVRAQREIQHALQDRDALLREVHHRVKNNLQVISSMLRLEASHSASTQTRDALLQMQGRIRSMALAHELLYKSESYARVDLASYLRELASLCFRTLAPAGVRLSLELAPLEVSMEQATPCGLVANELISNCLKHGFPEGRGGEVRVALSLGPEPGQALLRVCDDGVGLPQDFDPRGSQTLGLELVADLASQLGGELTVSCEPRTCFQVLMRLP